MPRIQIKRILCPTDFSEFSQQALAQAVPLARWYEAEVVAIHVYPLNVVWGGDVSYFPIPVPPDAPARARLQSDLERFVEPARAAGLRARAELREGDAAGEILAAAREISADLLVLGTHGRSGFERWVMGSVTEKVLRKARCPILTVRLDGQTASAFQRILCALDLSKTSRQTLDYALSLAQERSTQLTVLNVVEGTPEDEDAVLGTFNVPEYRRHLMAGAREGLKQLVPPDARAWCQIDEVVGTGRSWATILKTAEQRGSDLIVMGAHGANPIDLMFFGSTAHHVVRESRCPVLTVRSR